MRMMLGAMLAGSLLAGCAATPSVPVADGPQQCDAEGARGLVGSHVGAVDFAAGANVRIVCTTCSATEDHRPDRLNIRFDQATGIIKSVDCG